MKILLLAPFLPRPDARSGNPRAVFDRARLLSTHHRLTVATFVEPGELHEAAALQALDIKVHGVVRERWLVTGKEHKRKIPTTDHRSPTTGGATGFPLWRKRARLAAGLFNLEQPMLVQEFYNPRMARLLSALLKRGDFDLLMVEHILMAQYVAHLDGFKGPPIILTEHDVRLAFPLEEAATTRMGRASLKQFGRKVLSRFERMRWRRYEERQCRLADAVLVPSAEGAALLARELPGLKPYVVPFGAAHASELRLTQSEQDSKALWPSEDRVLLFVGNFDHPPNVDAALWLCGEIMPRVWQMDPGVVLCLVGKNPTREVQALASKRVIVTGEVPSVEPYLRHCTLFVAPLRLGGGTRIKLIEALGAGAAVITTTLGAQGLGVVGGQHLLIANDAAGFASAILEALADSSLRERLGTAGHDLVTSHAGETERFERLNSILEYVVARKQGKYS